LTKESKVVGGNFNAKATSAALDDLDGASLAALDLMQHRLARNAEALGGLRERNEPIGDVGHKASADLIGEADAPRRVGGGLLAGEQGVPEPAADRKRRDAELAGGVLDRHDFAGGIWRRRRGDACALAGGLHACAGERKAMAGASPLAVEDRGDLLVGMVSGEPADQVDRVLGELVGRPETFDPKPGPKSPVRTGFLDAVPVEHFWGVH
jgi:hypothetical protein